MTTTDETSRVETGRGRGARGASYRWIGLGLALVAIATIVFWVAKRGGPASPPEGDLPRAAAPVTLGVRLTLVTGAPGDDAAAVVRLYNARARLAQTVRDATASGREWKGTIDGESERSLQVQLGLDAWRASLRVERVDEQGDATSLPDGAVSIVSAPEGNLPFTGAETHTVIMAIQGNTLPLPGGRLRVQMTHAVVSGVSNAAAVEPQPADPVEQLSRGARVAELTRRFDLVAAKAAEMIAASPTSPLGYWYRGVALEAGGDLAGALVAYEAASARIAPGGQEPPVGLDLRIARLKRR